MSKAQYKNRYGDIYTFNKNADGEILWEGNFEWCRFGWPNVYDDAYKAYVEDGGNQKLEEFIKAIFDYDQEKQEYTMDENYRHLVYSDKTKINMVDPSGGPYLNEGQDMGVFDNSFKGMKIEKFERTDNNNIWKIIIKK